MLDCSHNATNQFFIQKGRSMLLTQIAPINSNISYLFFAKEFKHIKKAHNASPLNLFHFTIVAVYHGLVFLSIPCL